MNLEQKRKWIEIICENINMPLEATQKVVETLPQLVNFEDEIAAMNCREISEESWKQLKKRLEPDQDGWKILTAMLIASKKACQTMQTKGDIQQQIWATMGVFSRFVKEHFSELGRYGFDRDFWTWRQLCGQIIRLGCFEYETAIYDGKDWKEIHTGEPCILIHIPSDSNMSHEQQEQSIALARTKWKDLPFCCYSWLMAPALDEFLPANSKLREFRSRFEVSQVDLENKDYIRWVFNNTQAPVEKWPEETTLQRNIKAHIINDGKIGAAWGYLKSNEAK